jgi:FlaA1/EpsC-like NDP-sugar epimerase
MSFMAGYTNKSYLNMSFAFVDGLMIFTGFMMGILLRLGGASETIYVEYLTIKAILAVSIIQTVFYYLDLYEFKSLGHRIRMGICLLEALGISSIILAVIYYTFPLLSIGRGVFFLSLAFIGTLTFGWRLVYPWIVSNKIFKERVLIIGTGEVAINISKEIYENGQSAFEIVGFVDEDRERIGEEIGTGDHRGFQPDLFNLQRR